MRITPQKPRFLWSKWAVLDRCLSKTEFFGVSSWGCGVSSQQILLSLNRFQDSYWRIHKPQQNRPSIQPIGEPGKKIIFILLLAKINTRSCRTPAFPGLENLNCVVLPSSFFKWNQKRREQEATCIGSALRVCFVPRLHEALIFTFDTTDKKN